MGKSVYCKTYRVRYNKTHAMGTIKSINVWLVAKVLNKDIDTVWKQFLADFAVLKGAGKLDHVVSLGQLSTDYDRQVLHVAGPLHIKNLCSFANSEERQILEATLFARFSFLLRKYLYQIGKGLEQLHAQRICHRRVCLENVLVVNTEEDVELSDAWYKRTLEFNTVTESVYWPPELFHPDGRFTFQSDMYMVGILLIELLVGERVISRTKGPLCFQETLIAKYYEKMNYGSPKFFVNIVNHLFQQQPDKHWSASDLVNHLEEGVLSDQSKYPGGLGNIKTKKQIMAERIAQEKERQRELEVENKLLMVEKADIAGFVSAETEVSGVDDAQNQENKKK